MQTRRGWCKTSFVARFRRRVCGHQSFAFSVWSRMSDALRTSTSRPTVCTGILFSSCWLLMKERCSILFVFQVPVNLSAADLHHAFSTVGPLLRTDIMLSSSVRWHRDEGRKRAERSFVSICFLLHLVFQVSCISAEKCSRDCLQYGRLFGIGIFCFSHASHPLVKPVPPRLRELSGAGRRTRVILVKGERDQTR